MSLELFSILQYMKKIIFVLVAILTASIFLNIKFYTEFAASEAKNKAHKESKVAKKQKPVYVTHNMEYLEKRTKEETRIDMESGKPEFDCIGSLEVRQCTDYEWDIIVEKKAEKMKLACETEGHPDKKEACEYDMKKDKERLNKRRGNLVERLQKKHSAKADAQF